MQLPHLFGVGQPPRVRHPTPQEVMEIFHIPDEQLPRVRVSGRVDRLGKIDDHGTIAGDEDVEVGQVAVDDASAQHPLHLDDEAIVKMLCLFGREPKIAEPRRGVALAIADELHEEHPLDEVMRHRHANAGGVQAVDDVDLGRAPRGFVLRAAMLRAFPNRALIARVPRRAPLGVLRAVLKRAILGRFVDLRDADLAGRDHQVDLRLLPAHQRPEDIVEDTVVEQRLETFGDAHDRVGRRGRLVRPRPSRG